MGHSERLQSRLLGQKMCTGANATLTVVEALKYGALGLACTRIYTLSLTPVKQKWIASMQWLPAET